MRGPGAGLGLGGRGDGAVGGGGGGGSGHANSAALAGLVLSGWRPFSSRPLLCSRRLKTAHPYMPDLRMHQTVRFTDAAYIVLRFDPKSSMQEGGDWVTIYKDASCREHWGKDERI